MKRLTLCVLVGVLGLVGAVGVQGQQREGRGELPEKARPPMAAEPEAPTKSVPVTMGASDVPMVGVPRLVKVSGVVRDRLGEPSTGVVGITFALYGEQEGGAALWLETQNVELDAQGRYTALLGAGQVEGFPLEVLATDEPRWLGVWVQGEPEEQARILLVSVPYALKAAEAETLGGRSVSEFLLAEKLEEEVRSQVQEQVEKEVETRQEELEADQITSGASSFTASNATQVVLVKQNGSGLGLKAVAQIKAALVGVSNATTGAVNAVRGESASPKGRGVLGLAKAGSGQTTGVWGTAKSLGGRGVFGLGAARPGATRGVMGQTKSTQGIGVVGLAVATGGKPNGVRGVVKSAEGTAGVFINEAGGKILSGKGSGGTEVFSVDGSGRINGGLLVQQNATSPNLIGGFSGNSVTSGVVAATISGGGDNTGTNRVTDNFGTVGGGWNYQAGDNAGTTVDNTFAIVGGGQNNTANSFAATVGGGSSNTASGSLASVGGGVSNEASGFAATVGGGQSNIASGSWATVPGGHLNAAQGPYSFAAGRRAQANHDGAFVWGDSTDADVASTAANQFIARAIGGVKFYSSTDTTDPAPGVQLVSGASAWSTISDRASKENFAPVDGQALLARLNAIPLLTWNWRAQDASIRHMGPMAQDFRAAFELGSDDKHISTVDADGVALAAIQALYRLSLEKDAQLRKQQAQIQEQQAQMREQQAQLQMLQAQFQRQQDQMRELQAVLAAVKTQLTRSDKAQIAALELQE